MTYEALARKYRPKTFEEVVGQDPIVRTLTNAIRERRIHHAHVFSGVRGVGKTTVARLFAKALNCEKGPTPTPCLVCDPCREIAAGRDLDVIEMDAASRTGVDDVRDLIDTTRYAPARDRYKVFIIDEFHMLSKPAFNALLKTLEEPPPRVVFLMATTELHKVLPTVLSRTQQFDFRKVPLEQIASQLQRIAEAEGVKATSACFEMLGRAADGSVRDAESLLDQAIAFCGTTLREQDLRALLGLVPEQTVEAFLSAAAERDGAGLLRTIAGVLEEGHDLRVFHAGLIEGVRRLLVLRAAGEPEDLLGVSAEHQARLAAIAQRFSTESLLRVFSVLAGLEAPLKFSDQPRYIFEAAAIRIAALADLSSIEDLIARFDAGGPDAGPPAPRPGAGARRQEGPERGAPESGRPSTAAGKVQGGSSSKGPKGAVEPDARRAESSTTLAVPKPDRGAPEPGPQADPARAGTGPAAAGPAAAGPPAAIRDAREQTTSPEGDSPDPGHLQKEIEPEAPAVSDARPSASPSAQEIVQRFLASVAEDNETLAVLIEHASAIAFETSDVVLTFDETQAFARKRVEQSDNLAVLAAGAARAAGRSMSVRVVRIPKRTPAGPSLAAAISSSSAPASHPGREAGARRSGAPEGPPAAAPRTAVSEPAPERPVDPREPGLFHGLDPVDALVESASSGPGRAPASEAGGPETPGDPGTEDASEPDSSSAPDASEMEPAASGDAAIEARDAGGGVVTATMNGQKALLAIKIAPDAITPDDPEMLQDLIVAAVAEAARKVDGALQDQLGGLTGGMKIPGLF